MQTPVLHDRLADSTGERESAWIPTDIPLSITSQLRMRALNKFVDFCRNALDEIERELLNVEFGRDGLPHLKTVGEKIAKISIEADSWGFGSLYEIAAGLQMLLLNSGGRIRGDGDWEALRRGLKVLSGLLGQCEREFRWRLVTAETLACISCASADQ